MKFLVKILIILFGLLLIIPKTAAGLYNTNMEEIRLDIVFASKNKDKIKELKEIFKDSKYKILSLEDINLDIEVDENQDSYLFNSLLKSREISKHTNKIVMAEDSGLDIDYLGGKPGVHSARFLGEDTSYEYKNNYIIEQLKDIEEKYRTARFVSVVSVFFPNETVLSTRGVVEGFISHEARGENGFGYDPIFYLKEFGKTMAELADSDKNKISHRAKSLEKIAILLNNISRDK